MASTSGTKRPPRPPPPPPFARLSWPREQRNEDFNILPFDESPIMKLPEDDAEERGTSANQREHL
ncbi:hypothetical protein CCACVL1_05191, partial [Corchorus capsularis]